MAENIIPNEKQAEGLKLVNEAGIQLESLSSVILSELERINLAETSGIKSMVVRIKALSQVVMGAADEFDDEYLRDMHQTLNGI